MTIYGSINYIFIENKIVSLISLIILFLNYQLLVIVISVTNLLLIHEKIVAVITITILFSMNSKIADDLCMSNQGDFVVQLSFHNERAIYM